MVDTFSMARSRWVTVLTKNALAPEIRVWHTLDKALEEPVLINQDRPGAGNHSPWTFARRVREPYQPSAKERRAVEFQKRKTSATTIARMIPVVQATLEGPAERIRKVCSQATTRAGLRTCAVRLVPKAGSDNVQPAQYRSNTPKT